MDTIIKASEPRIKQWGSLNPDHVISLHEKLLGIALNNLSQVLLGGYAFATEEVLQMVQTFFFLIVRYELSLTKMEWFLPTKIHRRSNKVVKDMQNICLKLVDYCLSDKAPEANLIRELAKRFTPPTPILAIMTGYICQVVLLYL